MVSRKGAGRQARPKIDELRHLLNIDSWHSNAELARALSGILGRVDRLESEVADLRRQLAGDDRDIADLLNAKAAEVPTW